MPLTIQQLQPLLSRCGATVVGVAQGHLELALESSPEPLLFTAAIRESGTLLQLRTRSLAHVRSERQRSTVRAALLSANWKYKLIKLALRPEDGEVVGFVDVLLHGAEVTVRQLGACLRILEQVGTRMRRRVEQIIATGVDPGDSGADLGRELLAESALAMLFEAAQRALAEPAGQTADREPPRLPPAPVLSRAPPRSPPRPPATSPSRSPPSGPVRDAPTSPPPARPQRLVTRTDFDKFVDDVLKDD